MTLSPVVTTYVDSAIAQLRRQGLMLWPGKIPDEMRDRALPPSNDWKGWKPVANTVTNAELDKLALETKLKFPPLYRDFLKYLHFVDLTEVGVRFERHLSNDWQQVLRKLYFQSWPRERILDVGLLPFGDESMMDAGPVCFDTRRAAADGDCPVVFWDHEWAGTDKEIQPLFSSSAKMFECLTLCALTDTNFMHHDDDDDQTLLSQKRLLLYRFLDIDPNGAGGPARGYWTSNSGVLPTA